MKRQIARFLPFLVVGLLLLGLLAPLARAAEHAGSATPSVSNSQSHSAYLPWILQRPVLPFISCQPWPGASVRLSPAPNYATEGVLFADGWNGHEQVVL